MKFPRKDSNWKLIALLTSPLPCYTLVVKKWVLLLSMVFGSERDARFFFYWACEKKGEGTNEFGCGIGKMEWKIPAFNEPLVRQLGCRLPNFQVLHGGPEGDLHHECHRKCQQHLQEAKPPEKLSDTGPRSPAYIGLYLSQPLSWELNRQQLASCLTGT